MMRRRVRGFTLLEVMVALAIVSIGLIAAFNGIIQMAHSVSTMRDRALADWIAMNQITEIRIGGEFPEVGNFDGDVFFGNRDWRWQAEISETGVTDLRRIDMSVAHIEQPDDPVTIMTGFVSRGGIVGAASVDWWGGSLSEEPPAGDEDTADTEDAAEEEDAETPPPEVPEDEEE